MVRWDMIKRQSRARNPIARAVKLVRSHTIPSKKRYTRKEKHAS